MIPQKLFLLDAYALIFRAYYALIKMPRLTSTGFNTSAVFGFVNTLEEVLRKENPSHIAVCFDPPGPTFRHEAYEGYKAEREATPEDIKLSVPVIKEILAAYRIPVVEVAGYEADDVIGTLSVRAAAQGYTVYMMTPDKDFGQLVGPNILQYKPSYRGSDFEVRGEEEVCARYGLKRPAQVIDLLALVGDKIDCIPGCKGIGEKGAQELIAEFDNVDNLLAHTDMLKGARRRRIEEGADDIRFSKYLATICTDVPTDITPGDLVRQEPDREALFAIFDRLEFRTLKDRVGRRLGAAAPPKGAAVQGSLFDFADEAEQPVQTQAEQVEYQTVDSPETAQRFTEMLMGEDVCYTYSVTDGESDMTAAWRGTAVLTGKGCHWLSPTSAEARSAWLDLLAQRDIRKVSADAKRDYVVAALMRSDDAQSLENYYDISLAHYLLAPDKRHDIASMAEQYLHTTVEEMKRVKDVHTDPEGVLAGQAALRADMVRRLQPLLAKEVSDIGLTSLLEDVEMPLLRVLADMELTGVCIDTAALNTAATDMSMRLDEMEQEIHRVAGGAFNVNSPREVGVVLFERLGLDDKAKKTKTGSYSTADAVLEKLADRHPVVRMIQQYRQLKKLLTTYLTVLPQAIDPRDGRLHTNYNQTVTVTGRISSSSPNLQNIPVREEVGRDIRRAFIASPGCLFLSADYSQIELRLVADMADDPVMIEAFNEGRDIHAITASRIYEKDLAAVTADERRHAKTANFGILYGISAFGLASRLNISRQHAKELIDGYFRTFPTIHDYMDASVASAREKGYVATQMGRRRYLPDITSRNPVVRGYAERNAINAPIQGTAADIIKVAMVNIAARLRQEGLKARMIMQVHDELNFDVPLEETDRVRALVTECMADAYHGRVRMLADAGVADNWLDAH